MLNRTLLFLIFILAFSILQFSWNLQLNSSTKKLNSHRASQFCLRFDAADHILNHSTLGPSSYKAKLALITFSGL